MALSSLSPSASTTIMASICPAPLSSSVKSSSMSFSSNILSLPPPLDCFNKTRVFVSTRGRWRSCIVGMAPEEQRITRRSPLDFPAEWERPTPGRRPDVIPQFSPMKTPLPPPMPADPPPEEEEFYDDEEEEEEEEEENPDE